MAEYLPFMSDLEIEKRRRVYYQSIVYAVCNSLDRVFGTNTVCGAVETPSRQVQELMYKLECEVLRIRRGDFTPEEFQNLCHHRDEKPGCTRADFEAGCREYQHKLFGPKQVQLSIGGPCHTCGGWGGVNGCAACNNTGVQP